MWQREAMENNGGEIDWWLVGEAWKAGGSNRSSVLRVKPPAGTGACEGVACRRVLESKGRG